jgi:hypothetical protein
LLERYDVPTLIFDEENHIYQLDGKTLPSITGIIRPLVDYSMVPPAVLKNAANFGKAVHKLVELEETDTLDEDDMDDVDGVLRRVLGSYRGWREYAWPGMTPVCEIPMAHTRLGFAGTPDLIFDGVAVVELKSRDYNPLTDPIQLAAQELLWLANGGAKGDYCHAVLSLKASGDRKFIEVPKKQSKEALSRFRFMLDTHKANQQIQSWKGK